MLAYMAFRDNRGRDWKANKGITFMDYLGRIQQEVEYENYITFLIGTKLSLKVGFRNSVATTEFYQNTCGSKTTTTRLSKNA